MHKTPANLAGVFFGGGCMRGYPHRDASDTLRPVRRMLRPPLLLSLLCMLLLAACSSGSGASPSPTPTRTLDSYAERGPYGVGVTTLQLADTTRPTAPNGAAPGSPERDIAVEVWYPADAGAQAPEDRDVAVDRSSGRHPLIIFAHGFSAFRRQSASYTQHLASRGYIVAAPDFPQSRAGTPGGPRIAAVLDQPADVSFVIDELLKLDGASSGVFAGTIDKDRIGMTGHSLGGLTTMLTAYGDRRDARITAVAPISPVGCLLPGALPGAATVPALIIGGSRERIVDPSSIYHAYLSATPPKYYVQIVGADHVRFADIDTTDDSLGDIVTRVAGGDVVADAVKVAQSVRQWRDHRREGAQQAAPLQRMRCGMAYAPGLSQRMTVKMGTRNQSSKNGSARRDWSSGTGSRKSRRVRPDDRNSRM